MAGNPSSAVAASRQMWVGNEGDELSLLPSPPGNCFPGNSAKHNDRSHLIHANLLKAGLQNAAEQLVKARLESPFGMAVLLGLDVLPTESNGKAHTNSNEAQDEQHTPSPQVTLLSSGAAVGILHPSPQTPTTTANSNAFHWMSAKNFTNASAICFTTHPWRGCYFIPILHMRELSR